MGLGSAGQTLVVIYALLAVQRGDKVYREARDLIEEITQARELGDLRKYRAQLHTADLLIIDDLFIRKLPVRGRRTRRCADGSL